SPLRGNRVAPTMSPTRPVYPQLRKYFGIAAKRRDGPKAAILVGEAEQRRPAPEDALWMDAPDFAVAQAGLRIQSSI
ncbi:MAG: hypothetical protein WA694_21145, partial [Pseudolabrys sp.]